MYETLGFFAAAQQAALQQGIMRGIPSSSMISPVNQLHVTPAISKKDYKDEKIKYSKFKKCENPIKQSELTYRGELCQLIQ